MARPTRASSSRLAHRTLGIDSLERRDLLSGSGLLAQYYSETNLQFLALSRNESTIDLNWGTGAPAVTMPPTFGARFTGQFESSLTEDHQFYVVADGGVRLWINGQKTIDQWNSEGLATFTSAPISLISGRKYDLQLDYRNQSGNASVKLQWSSQTHAIETIPSNLLYPSDRGSISVHQWQSLSADTIDALQADSRFPNTPNSDAELSSFESINSVANNGGSQIVGLVSPSVTGTYRFAIAASQSARLYLSNTSTANNKQLIASVTSGTTLRNWTASSTQLSDPIILVAGQSYYIEALSVDSSGDDHLSVGWRTPDTPDITVIQKQFLTPLTPVVKLFSQQTLTQEGSSVPATIEFVRSGAPLNNPLTVQYTLSGTATLGSDYNASGTVTFPAGAATVLLPISALTDSILEPTESVIVELMAGDGYQVPYKSERTNQISIVDTSPAPPGGVGGSLNMALNSWTAFGANYSQSSDPTHGQSIRAQIATVPANFYESQLVRTNSFTVTQNDIQWVEFWARSNTAQSGRFYLVSERNGSPYTKSLIQSVTVGSDWQLFRIGFTAAESYTVGQLNLSFQLGTQLQSVEIAAVKWINYGPSSILQSPSGLSFNQYLANPNDNYANTTPITVAGQSFTSATRVQVTTVPPDVWRTQAITNSQAKIFSGDTVRIKFYARDVTPAGQPRGHFNIGIQRSDNFQTLFYQEVDMAAYSDWHLFTFDVPMQQDWAAGSLQFVINYGYKLQTIDFANISWTNLTHGIDPSTLPDQISMSTYGGRDGTSDWRDTADDDIAANRMTNLTVNVTDAAGNPINGALVSIRQKKQDFKFGSAVSAYDGKLADNPVGVNVQYQNEFLRLFNTGVLENNLKWPDFINNRQLGIDAANWLVDHDIYLRGHNAIWPSRQYMPQSIWNQYDALAASDPAAARTYLRNQINARIQDVATTFANLAGEWDVVNEPYANHDVMDILGNAELLQWYRLFKNTDPNATLGLNDYDIFTNNGNNAAHRANFDSWLTQLNDQALVDIIGEQSHYNDGNLTDIGIFGSLLDTYHNQFNLPIAITEFDVNSKDRQLQADYLRDYYTMAFSNEGVSELLSWGFWAGAHWLPDAAMYNYDFSARPNGQVYEDLVFGNWWTDVRGTTTGGSFDSDVFKGDYEIVVSYGGQQVVLSIDDLNSNRTITAQLNSTTLPQSPTDIGLAQSAFFENNVAFANLTQLSATDSNAGDTFTYSLVAGAGDTDNTRFTISGNQLKSNFSFNYESKSSYSIRLLAQDQTGLSFEKAFVVNVLDVNEFGVSKPADIDQNVDGISENAAINAIVGITAKATDADGTNNTVTYSLSNSAGGRFKINTTTGVITLAIANLDYETATSHTITVLATSSDGSTNSANFIIPVVNVNEPVALTRASATVSGNVLSSLTNTGTWNDPENGAVTLTASLGAVVKNSDGTWSWSYTPTAMLTNQTVTITASDGVNNSTTTFVVNAAVAVTRATVYYKGSAFASGGVDAALDTSAVNKLVKANNTSQTMTFGNISNYSRGLNGLVFDVAGLVATTLTAADFEFRIGNSNTPSTWASAPAPSLIQVTPASGTTPARIRIEWPDNAIKNTWLQVVLKANANTGLAAPQTYYVGHALGEVTGSGSFVRLTVGDVAAVKGAVSAAVVSINDPRDINKDRRVTVGDVALVKDQVTASAILNMITIPAA